MNLAAVESPAAVSYTKSMIWLFQFLTLVSCLGSGNAVTQTTATPLLVVNGVLGESVTLPLKFPGGQDTSVIWHHDKITIVFIQPKGAQIQVIDPKRKDRLHVAQFYSLQINNLTMADSGCYYAQISTSSSTEISKYNLGIFRRLRNLQVTNHTELSDNGTCEIHLICSVENPNDHVSFRWQITGNTPIEEANLTISWNPKNSSEQTYTCTAMNPVSNLSFSLSAQSLCKGAFNKKNQHPNIIWIIIVLSFFCIAMWPMFVWRKRMTGFLQFSTHQTQNHVEILRNSDYGPISPGNTVYAQVTHPNMKTEIPIPMKNNDSSTIYSTISQSQQGNCHHLGC
ncbi:SLAM family member 6 isoform X1 [Phyllostomus hastatus]|uniref:SLAM family member 6 isoform X1 n=1 Tax=Phyllostomus hastatus TaxID=9423 RepID=UPI001E67FB82|nr:SLAM family member 6 isoform X1 [Phyllostomus hastatus]